MLEKLTNNFVWKILSVIFAFILWLVVINYEDPLITRDFENIPVNIINEESITSQRKAIEYKDGKTVTLKLRGKRSIIDRLSTSDIVATADMSRVSITGAVEIDIDVGDVQIIEKKPTTMKIELENVITVQKEVQYYFEGEPNENYVLLEPIITPNSIQVSGPESKIKSISSVIVSINVDDVTKDVTLFANPQVQDVNNEEVTGLSKSVNQVEVKVPVQKVKAIPITVETTGNVAQGYELTGIILDDDKITVKGDNQEVNELNSIIIRDISIQGLSESTSRTVNIQPLLPNGVEIYKDDTNITIQINVEKIEDKIIEITKEDINIEQLPEGLDVIFLEEDDILIELSGLKKDLDNITVTNLKPTLNLRQLESGEHDVNINLNIPETVTLASEIKPLKIELKEK